MTDDRRRLVCREIVADMARDVRESEGKPFTGPVVAEQLGYLAAAISALAEIVETLLPPLPSQPAQTPTPTPFRLKPVIDNDADKDKDKYPNVAEVVCPECQAITSYGKVRELRSFPGITHTRDAAHLATTWNLPCGHRFPGLKGWRLVPMTAPFPTNPPRAAGLTFINTTPKENTPDA